jgi:hypothetical protein
MTNQPSNEIDEILEAFGEQIYSYAPDYYPNVKKQMLTQEEAKSRINALLIEVERQALQSVLDKMPKKKNLAYRQGRELPVLSGIELKDPEHVKAKKYINCGYNQAIEEVKQKFGEMK